jgi:hypothetical protein
MQTDPILREIYRVKEERNQEIGGDVEKLFERFREFARQHPEGMVQPKRKRNRKNKRQP